MNVIVKSSLLTAGLAFTLAAQADAPSSLHLPDTHSDKNMGKISLYRNQIKDYKFGKNDDITNNTVFITLDTMGDKVFTLSLHEDPVVNTEIAETLREAYLHDMTVTLYSSKFVKEGGAMKIHAVQLERAGK
jgi:hypothetical protein